ncbi:Hsp20/alpha crystallin family protein [Spiribacter halobius]|uniref:Heat-shock protein n=1 Tax=Sediminicurvatus halobius TaxID=2182432 RepID=A0A2U2N1F9_9GAMM|nr:Hsp20/alpha crystallin family protein [Spiribacter halobius]PWG62804.1 heat-shock protein [Spiribacter halobius]UEX77049.1 Hsp20/alpha crystallin family protein [Spiribacter halobius]
MSELKTVQGQNMESQGGSAAEAQNVRHLLPLVDIGEQDDSIRIFADMPGVAPDAVSIEVDNQVLTLEGRIAVDMPEGIAATYAEVGGSRYRRRFSLGQEVDTEGIRAEMDNGVVTVTLPKKSSHRRRRIEVKAA